MGALLKQEVIYCNNLLFWGSELAAILKLRILLTAEQEFGFVKSKKKNQEIWLVLGIGGLTNETLTVLSRNLIGSNWSNDQSKINILFECLNSFNFKSLKCFKLFRKMDWRFSWNFCRVKNKFLPDEMSHQTADFHVSNQPAKLRNQSRKKKY